MPTMLLMLCVQYHKLFLRLLLMMQQPGMSEEDEYASVYKYHYAGKIVTLAVLQAEYHAEYA